MTQIGSIGSLPVVPANIEEQLIASRMPMPMPVQLQGNNFNGGGSGVAENSTGVSPGRNTSISTTEQPLNGYSWSDAKIPSGVTANTIDQAAAPSGGTNVFNDLNGRDPDLVHGGEKFKLADGSTYTATKSDTIEAIARKTGNSVSQLMQQNGMNTSLYGKNDSGKYFSVGRMVTNAALSPSPGTTTTTNPVPATTGTSPDKTVNTDILEDKQALATLLKFADEFRDGAESKALVQRAISDPSSMTTKEVAELTELQDLMRGKEKAVQGSQGTVA